MSKPTYCLGLLSDVGVLESTVERFSSQTPVPVAMSATRMIWSLGIEGWICSGGPNVLMKRCWTFNLSFSVADLFFFKISDVSSDVDILLRNCEFS